MQQRLLVLLETAIVEGKARERSSATFRTLGDVSSEVPFFNLPAPSASGESESDVVNWTTPGTTSETQKSGSRYFGAWLVSLKFNACKQHMLFHE